MNNLSNPTYRSWSNMRSRCHNPNVKVYAQYGGRGIKICPEWDEFEQFAKDMGNRPNGLSLDRINPDGDYTRENCRWANYTQQATNRRNVKIFTINGESLCLTEWCRRFGISLSTVRNRLRLGMSPEAALMAQPLQIRPVGKSGARNIYRNWNKWEARVGKNYIGLFETKELAQAAVARFRKHDDGDER